MLISSPSCRITADGKKPVGEGETGGCIMTRHHWWRLTLQRRNSVKICAAIALCMLFAVTLLLSAQIDDMVNLPVSFSFVTSRFDFTSTDTPPWQATPDSDGRLVSDCVEHHHHANDSKNEEQEEGGTEKFTFVDRDEYDFWAEVEEEKGDAGHKYLAELEQQAAPFSAISRLVRVRDKPETKEERRKSVLDPQDRSPEDEVNLLFQNLHFVMCTATRRKKRITRKMSDLVYFTNLC